MSVDKQVILFGCLLCKTSNPQAAAVRKIDMVFEGYPDVIQEGVLKSAKPRGIGSPGFCANL